MPGTRTVFSTLATLAGSGVRLEGAKAKTPIWLLSRHTLTWGGSLAQSPDLVVEMTYNDL